MGHGYGSGMWFRFFRTSYVQRAEYEGTPSRGRVLRVGTRDRRAHDLKRHVKWKRFLH